MLFAAAAAAEGEVCGSQLARAPQLNLGCWGPCFSSSSAGILGALLQIGGCCAGHVVRYGLAAAARCGVCRAVVPLCLALQGWFYSGWWVGDGRLWGWFWCCS